MSGSLHLLGSSLFGPLQGPEIRLLAGMVRAPAGVPTKITFDNVLAISVMTSNQQTAVNNSKHGTSNRVINGTDLRKLPYDMYSM